MATPAIVRRFRKELREQHDINSDDTVYLQSDEKRVANIAAARLLLHEAFNDRISVVVSEEGFVCGSREEAALNRLMQYTRQDVKETSLLLAEIPADDLNEYLKKQGINKQVFVPMSAEAEFLETLADDFPSVRYGL